MLQNKTTKTLNNTQSWDIKSKKNKKVNINNLLNRVIADKRKEKFENTILISSIFFTVIVIGIIVSL